MADRDSNNLYLSIMNSPNDDERVRDHLANERTYLAWTRTGMATMGFGVLIAKLRYLFAGLALEPPSRGIVHASDIGLVFTVVGLLIVCLSAWRFTAIQKQIRQSTYRSSKTLIMGLSGVVIVLGMAIVWYLIQSSGVPFDNL